ncbi:CynX/NimT family MFS transporter [Bacillus atrophaeus]|uniref:CynX/NimT family MFS transporter n=1 Tax=Bacillus atrophaeus TaxID=1452 RepID=UPI00227F8E65|nr:MFS transporter [Bacillus atrophaeus]MCY8467276.1 MFS transporter [Bacillus atrophaeus]MCY8479921.1 MFS transporter [Bacillus atrophaeus]MCY8918993.1 MFS transporter [Bacillus atrophaeus]MCY8922416.1 MFS transporter [Bacillus atrophaeus]MCY8927087.1 MFS transporter [Bacillus atrophaeus]
MSLGQVELKQGKHEIKTNQRKKILLLTIGIILIGANLRAPLTSVGPLIASIRDNLGMSNALAGTLTTVPLLAFAFLSPFVPMLSRRFGTELVLMSSLFLLTVGILLRSLAGIGSLFAGTILLGLAIAVCNVLLPSFIKHRFSRNLGMMTGVYSVSMNLCGAIASGISIPVASLSGLGWKGALGCWSVLSLIAVLIWIPLLKGREKPMKAAGAEPHHKSNLWRSQLAWNVTLFMGLQSLIFYTVIAWLPEILQQKGLSSSSAGWMLSLMQFSILPITFIVPILAGRMKNQRILVTITGFLFVTGIAGVLYGSAVLIPLWVMMIGIAGGCAFSLAMMFFSLRTQNAHQAAALSGMAQSFGYLLAAIGPLVFGLLHDVTHSWTIPLFMLIVVSLLIFLFGMGAAKAEHIKTK